jgi:4-hydroxy-tetrahydrodipicolinate synthase
MSNDTALRLAQHPNIVGLKDATGDIGRLCDLALRAPKDFALYSGDDATGMAFMLCGGHGVISVTANIAPKLMRELCDAATSGNTQKAREINDKLQGLHKQLFVEPNPIPAKWALTRMNRIPSGIRLPLTPLSASAEAFVEAAMKQAEVL